MEGDCKVRGLPKILDGKVFWGHLYKHKRARVQMNSSLYSIAHQVITSGQGLSQSALPVRKLCLFEEAFVSGLTRLCSGWWIQEGLHPTFSMAMLSPGRMIKLHKVTE